MRLKDPEEAAAYINAAFEEKDIPEVLLIALTGSPENEMHIILSALSRKAG